MVRSVFPVLVVVALLLTACGGFGGGKNENPYSNPEYQKYFTGKQGIIATFLNMPARLYYYGPDDQADNTVTFSVQVQNEGASFSRGGIYVSGFDPNMFEFQEIPISPTGACGLSFGQIGFGSFGGMFSCDGVQITGGGGHTTVRIDSLASLIQGIGARFGKSWFDDTRFDLGMNYDGANGQFNIDLGDMSGNLEYYQHGRLFIAMLAGIRFDINGGREFLLAGDTYDFPGGEVDIFNYNGRIANWPQGLDQTTQTFMLTSCYQYTTYADPIICVDPEPFSENRKVCVPRGRTWNGGNGAPVAITSIEQENTPKKIIFRINVQNVGAGTVYDAGKLEKCSPYYPGRVTPDDLNVVYLGDVRIGDIGLAGRSGRPGMECSPQVIRLDPRTGRGSSTCTYPIEYTNLKSAYQTPLVVELWYGYSQVQQRQVYVKRVA